MLLGRKKHRPKKKNNNFTIGAVLKPYSTYREDIGLKDV